MTNAFDAYLRRTNVSSASGATVLTTNGYTFDAGARLSTARDGTFLATYSYLANSPLVSQIEFKSNTTVRLTTTKTYDQLNRLTSIASVGTGSTPSVTSYSYSYNDANQRTRVNLADGSFWIYPVRYGLKILLRLRPAVTKGRPLLHRLHPRFATTPSLASKWRGRVHTGPPAGRIDLLRGVSASAGRHSAGEIFEVSLGQTLSEKPPAKLSHGVNEYDSLGQVKSGKRYWIDWTPVAGQQFEYGFDDTRPVRGGNSRHLRRMEMDAIAVDGDARSNISHGVNNRNSTKSGGDAAGASLRLASYTNNSLNQITGRDVPAYLNVIGVATATATNVNVNNTLAYRKSEYYRVELNPNNASAAVWQSVTNRAVQSGTTNLVTGNAFLPKNPEVFAYDADGSPHEIALQDLDLGVTTDLAQSKHPVSRLSHGEILTNDGRWAYVWDGENRLVRQFAPTTAPSGSVVALMFGYDWQGRRISKTVSNWTGSAWSRVLHEKYFYDGWNLLATLNGTNDALVRSFMWGSDLSGSMQGAGGVGGLLLVRDNANGTHFCGHDGNGNVTLLVNTQTGTNSATYEYGPFGENLRATGPMAKANPFRFSSKFQDDESDLLYYGYRYHSATTGMWLSRDPYGEEGGLNLYAFTENSPVDSYDVLGLWTGGDHKKLTGDSFAKADVSSALGTCANPVLEWLKHWNLQQDEGAAFQENRRHFNRNIDKPTGSTAAKMRSDYSAYLVEELGRFNKKLGPASPSLQDCKDALESLGRLTHSWQDYYAHAIILVKAKADKTLWTRKPPITGSPDNPAGSGGQIVPSSWNNWHDSGEHGWSEIGGAEGDARQADARLFVTGKYKSLIPQWAAKCKCYCDKLGSP